MVALALSLRPLGPPPMPACGERPSRDLPEQFKRPASFQAWLQTRVKFFFSIHCPAKAPPKVFEFQLGMTSEKKSATASSCSSRAGCLFSWLIECREQGPVAQDPGTRGCYVSLQPQTSTALGPKKLGGKLMSVSMPGWRARLFATVSGYCVLRETVFQNKRPLAFSPCHPVWNIKCRLQRGRKKMPIAGHTKTLRLFFWITAHIYSSFHIFCDKQAVSSSITVFTVAYASCNYAMKEFISSGNLKQR